MALRKKRTQEAKANTVADSSRSQDAAKGVKRFAQPFARAGKTIRSLFGRVGAHKDMALRVLLVVLALVVCAIPPIFVNDIIGYLPLIVLVVALVISFLYLQVLVHGFSFSEDSLAPSCERGSEIDFVLNFVNKTPLVYLNLQPYIYISDLFGDNEAVTPVSLCLMPFEKRDFHFQAKFDHIGTYSAGIQKIVISDLLGLFTHTIANCNRHRVEVQPRLFVAENVPVSSEVSSDSQKPRQVITVDDMDYAGVRDYVWGDPIKTIHWKLSARNPQGDYFTRLFEAYNNPGIAIILDTASPRYDAESLMFLYDSVVESALSVNQFANGQGLESVLLFKNKYGETSKLRLGSFSDYPDLISDLPRIKPADGKAASEVLRHELNTLHSQDNVAFCTSQLSEESLQVLVSMKMRKRNPMLFLSVPPSLDSAEIKDFIKPLRRLDEAQIPYFVISSAADLGSQAGVDNEARAARAVADGIRARTYAATEDEAA